MKKMILLAASAVLFAGAAFAQQPNTTEAYPSSIQVTGQAEIEIEPNEIYVKITIDEAATKTKITVAEQEKKMIAELRKLGINTDKDLQVGDMSGNLKNYVIRKNNVQTSKTYILKVTNASTLDKVFNSLGSINISEMSVQKVTRSDLPELKNRLRIEAIKAAKQNAETLAGAIGQKVGKAFNITDYNSMGGGEIMYDMPMARSKTSNVMLGGTMAEDTGMEFQNLRLTYSVSARFVLN